jgi:hypothetical protein
MVNEEIVGGIKNALERGDSLRDAMMSFFNAGYDRKEIEEAAAVLLHYPIKKAETKTPVPEIKKVEPKVEHKIELIPIPKVVQKVSSYGEEKPKEIIKPKKKGFLFFKPKAQKELKEMPQPIPKVIIHEEPRLIPKELPKTIISAMPQTTPKKIEKQIPRKVSSSSAMTPQEKVIIAILVGLLIFLIGLLVVIFLFRQQLIDFISTMVS